MKPWDPWRLDRRLMRAAARESRTLLAGGYTAYKASVEAALSSFTGRRFCVLTDGGRTALRLAALALRPGGGTAGFPDITHPSLAEAAEGFRLLPLDIDPLTLNLSPAALRAAAPGLDLLLLPHMFGAPAPVEEALRLARRHGFAVIEDASQALGGSLRGRKFGAFGELSVLSLSPYKPVSSPLARAGALLCDSPAVLKKVLALNPPPPKPQVLPFLKLKLARLPETLGSSRATIAIYRRELKAFSAFIPPGTAPDAQELPLVVPGRAAAERLFRKAGVPLERPYRPLRLEKGLPGALPAADAYWRGALHLPAWPLMTAAEARRAAGLAKKHLAAALKPPPPGARLSQPSYVALDLTYRCGLSCPFCFVKRNAAETRERGLADWLKTIKELGPGPKRFYLTGGEPLLVPYLPALVRALNKAGHSSLVTTSLFAPAAAAAALAAAGPSEIVVSAHGWPALHDKCAGAGAWRALRRNLEVLKKRRGPGTRLTAWCTINASNHARLLRVYKALEGLAPDAIAFNHLEFVTERDLAETRSLLGSAGLSTPMRACGELAAGVDAAALEREICKIRAEAALPVAFYPDLAGPALRGWYDPSASPRRAGYCRGQYRAAWFSPSGERLTCQPLAAAAGGHKAAAFRRLLARAGGFLPACRRCGREPFSSAAQP